MKNTIILYFSFISLLFQSCKSISVLESYNYNYYIFNTAEIKPLTSIEYKKGKFLLSKTRKANYNFDAYFYKKQFDIVKDKDTMYIHCFCIDETNIYFKDLKFKKGSYFLDIQKKLIDVNGSDLKVPKKVKSIIFIDYLTLNPNPASTRNKIKRKDILLNDIKFKVLDFSDTLNIKLTSISKDKFWDNNFMPKNIKE